MNITDANFPTAESRLEKFYSWMDHTCNYLKRGVELDAQKYNVIAMIDNGVDKQWYYTHNIATDVADIFYAEQAVNASLTEDFLSASNRCELANPAGNDSIAKADTYSALGSPITASRKTITATYPLVSDPDSDNTGGGVDIASWDYSWTTTDFDTAAANDVRAGVIHNAAGSPVGGSVLLSHYNFGTPFPKSSSDTLKVFHNHRLNGV